MRWICVHEIWYICNIWIHYHNDDCWFAMAVTLQVSVSILFCNPSRFHISFGLYRDKLRVPEIEKPERNDEDVEMDDLTAENLRLTTDSKKIEVVGSK